MRVLQDLRQMLRRLRGERRVYASGLTALFLVNFSEVLAPVFMAVAIDLAEGELKHQVPQTPPLLTILGWQSGDFTLFGAVGLFLMLHLAANVFRFPMLMGTAIPSHRIGQRLRNGLVDRLLNLSRPFYDRSRSGDLMSLGTSDINAARMFYGPGILVGSDTFIMVTLVLAVLFSLSWQLTLVAMIPMPIIAIITNRLARAEYRRFEAVQEDIGNLTERARESFAGIRILQAYAREEYDRARFTGYSKRHLHKNLHLARIRVLFEPTFDLMLGTSTVLVLIVGGQQVLAGELSLGTLVGVLFLVGYLAGPMIGFGWAVSLFQRGRASIKRLETLFDEPIEIHDAEGAVAASDGGRITVTDLTFEYPQDSRPPTRSEDGDGATLPPVDPNATATREGPVLQGISFDVAAGKRLGIVGPVASGKSTLVSLLVRLYEPPLGAVSLDGIDVRQLTLESLRHHVVLAPQDTFLFSDTVRKNILLPPDTQASAEELAGLACLKEEIEAIPDRYEALVGERGVNLSGGQRQRLAIARGLAADPQVLILDDCLSAVDAATEEAILENLDEALRGRTGIIVSHRVIAVQRCDEIIVLEEGRITARGTHQSLLVQPGYYRTIAMAQMDQRDRP